MYKHIAATGVRHEIAREFEYCLPTRSTFGSYVVLIPLHQAVSVVFNPIHQFIYTVFRVALFSTTSLNKKSVFSFKKPYPSDFQFPPTLPLPYPKTSTISGRDPNWEYNRFALSEIRWRRTLNLKTGKEIRKVHAHRSTERRGKV